MSEISVQTAVDDSDTGVTLTPSVRRWRRIALVMLVLVYVVNFIDRNIIVILQEPIREEFGLADWQLGVMTGAAFALFYTTLGVPIARLADRGGVTRTTIIAVSLALWSGMTALCGLASSYWQLLLARVGVGVGEAGCTPSAMSIISDYYDRHERGRAMGFYSLGIPIGSMLGLLFGGWIAQHFGWRAALMAIGLPGILLAIIFKLLVREPPRGLADGRQGRPVQYMSMAAVMRAIAKNRTYLQLLAAGSLGAMCSVGVSMWIPSFFMRAHGMSLAQVGVWWGITSGTAGLLGTLLGGFLMDRLGRRSARAMLLVPMAGMLAAIPFHLAAVTADHWLVALVLLFVPTLLAHLWIAPNMALTQSLSPLPMRATAGAVTSLVQNVVGGGLGPVLLGAVSDSLTSFTGSPTEGLRWSLILMSAAYLWAASHFLIAARTVERDLVH